MNIGRCALLNVPPDLFRARVLFVCYSVCCVYALTDLSVATVVNYYSQIAKLHLK